MQRIAKRLNEKHPLKSEDDFMPKNILMPPIGLLIFTIAITTGCSSALSRSNAGDLISKDPRFPKTAETRYSGTGRQDDDTGENFLRAMRSQGYIDAAGKYTAKGEAAKVNWKRYAIEGYGYETWFVPVAERELVEVTGISEPQNPTEALAEATFTWHWKPNEIGKEMNVPHLGKTVYTGAATFKKFDDGWRVQRLEFQE
jgi:hypothetical protein